MPISINTSDPNIDLFSDPGREAWKLARYRFFVGGYLHVDNSEVVNGLESRRTDAIRRYSEQGGRLGNSTVKALAVCSPTCSPSTVR